MRKPTLSRNLRRSIRMGAMRFAPACLAVTWLFWASIAIAANATNPNASNDPSTSNDPPLPTVLELHNGDFIRGRLLGLKDNSLTWQSPFMVDPLEFTLDRVAGIVTKPQQGKYERGAFAVELSNGRDQLFGDLRSIDDQFVSLESPTLGSLRLRHSHLRRVWRVDRTGESFQIPTRLGDWTRLKPEHWTTRRGVITTETSGATLHADVKMPRQVQIEFELLYDAEESAFAIHFGTDERIASHETAYSIETWGKQIVAQRRNKQIGDVLPLGPMKSGSAQFVVYLDRDRGQMLVYGKQGEQLGEITVSDTVNGKSAVNEVGNGITIVNRKGILQLKQLRMSSWSGTSPRSDGDATVTVAVDGEIHDVTDVRLDEGTLTLGKPTLDDGDETDLEPKEFNIDKLTRLNFHGDNKSSGPAVAICRDGTRLTGELSSANEEALMVQIAASEEPVSVPLNKLKSLHVAKPSVGAPQNLPPYTHRLGTLELMDTHLSGWLVEMAEASTTEATDGNRPKHLDGSCLVWQVSESEKPTRLRSDLYGRIVYALPKSRTRKPVQRANVVQARNAINLALFNGRVNRNNTRQSAYTSLKLAGAAIHLRSGDTIPCSIESITDSGVQIESKLTETKLIPHKLIKAAQLNDTVAMPYLGEKKRERFLTLPRMQRDIPPQHLLFSTRGDILRGSIVSMSDSELDLELRMDSYRLPRSRVSAIVWLHQDELEPTKSSNSRVGDDEAVRDQEGADSQQKPEKNQAENDVHTDSPNGNVQVVGKNGGSRFTFYVDSFSDQTLYGHSEVLQNVHAKVADMDQLLLGPFIQKAASSLPYHRWRLTSARDPKFVTDGDEASGESTPGTESALVGQPAPAIDLLTLDGEEFSLADHRGHCVVLDFWATWCGPCLQVMPQVDEVVEEFKGQDVQLFAVNLEETADQIRATLERRNLDVNVVLDRDGVAAGRYEATAIPQTVVVAPDGTIARVFVGSSRNFKEQLRAAIKEVVEAK